MTVGAFFVFLAQAQETPFGIIWSVEQKGGIWTMYHHVRKGQTLHHIAKHHRTHVHLLIILNPHIHNPHLIYPGQRIRVR